jgi:hypothetical protein
MAGGGGRGVAVARLRGRGPATLMIPVESRRESARSWTATGFDATPTGRTITTYTYCIY